MSRPKGLPKTGGRKPGTKNRSTDILAICADVGIDVMKEMVKLAAHEIDANVRFMRLKEIAPYIYCKRKEVLNLNDHSPEELLEAAEKKIDGTKTET